LFNKHAKKQLKPIGPIGLPTICHLPTNCQHANEAVRAAGLAQVGPW
jgi:hypothetical protein